MPIQISKKMAQYWDALFVRLIKKQPETAKSLPRLSSFIANINLQQDLQQAIDVKAAIEEIKQYTTKEKPEEPLRSFVHVITGCLLILDETNLKDGIEHLRKTDLKQTGGLFPESLPQLELPLDDHNWLRVAQYVDLTQTPQGAWSRYIYERTFAAAANIIIYAIQPQKPTQAIPPDDLAQAIHLMEQYAEEKIPSKNKKDPARHLLLDFYRAQKDPAQLPNVRHYLAMAQPDYLEKLPESFWRRTLVHLYDKNVGKFLFEKKDTVEFVTKYNKYITNTLIHQLNSVVSVAKLDRDIYKQKDSLRKLQSQRPQDTAAIAQAIAELEKILQERRAKHFPSPENFSKELYLMTQAGIEPLSSIAAYIYVVYLAHYPESDVSDSGLESQQSTDYWYKHIKIEELEKFRVNPTHFTIVQVAKQSEMIAEMIALHPTLLVSILNNLQNPTLDTPEAQKAWRNVSQLIQKLPEKMIKPIFARYGDHILKAIETTEITEETKQSLENIIKYGTESQQTQAHILLGAHEIQTAVDTGLFPDDNQVMRGILHFEKGNVSLDKISDYFKEKFTDEDYYKMMIRGRIPEAFDNDVEKCSKFVLEFMSKFYVIALEKYEASKGERFNHPGKQEALAALKLIKDYGKKDSLEKTVASYIVIKEHAKGETQHRNAEDVGAPIVGSTNLEDYITDINISPDIRAELARLGIELTPDEFLPLLEKLHEYVYVFNNPSVRQFLLNEIEYNLNKFINQADWEKVGKLIQIIQKLPNEEMIKQIFEHYGDDILTAIETTAMTPQETKQSLENIIKYSKELPQTKAHMLLGAHEIQTAVDTGIFRPDAQVRSGIIHFQAGNVSPDKISDYFKDKFTDEDYYKMMIRDRIPEALSKDPDMRKNIQKRRQFIKEFMPKFYPIALAKYEAIKKERFLHPDKQEALDALKLIKDYGEGDSLEKAIASYIFISEHAKGETQYRNIKDVGAPIVGNTILEDYITNISVSADLRAELAKLGVELTPKTLLHLLKNLPPRVFNNAKVRQFLLNEIETNLSKTIDQSEINKSLVSFGDLMGRAKNVKISIISEKQELYKQTVELYGQFTQRSPDSTEKNQALYRQAALAAHTLTIDDAIVYFTKITPSLDPVITFSHAHMPTLSPTQLQQILVKSAATNQWNCWSVIHSNRSLARNVDFQILILDIETSQEVNMIQWEKIPANILVLWYQYGSPETRGRILKDVFKKLSEKDKKILGKKILQYSNLSNLHDLLKLEYQDFMNLLNSALPIEEMLDLLINKETSSEFKDKITQYLISQRTNKLFEMLEKYSRPFLLDRLESAVTELILPDRFEQQKQYARITAQLVYNDHIVSRWMRHCEKHKLSPIPAFMLLSPQEQIDFTKHWYSEEITQLLEAFSVFMQKHTITMETLQTIGTLLQTKDIIRKLASDTVIKLFEMLLKEQSANAIKIIQKNIDQLSAVQRPLVLSALLKNQVFIELALAANETTFIERLTTNYIQLIDAEQSWEDVSAIYANFRGNDYLQQHLLKQIFASPKHVASMRSMLGQAEKHPAQTQIDNWPVYRFLPKLIRTLNHPESDAWEKLFGAETALPLADLLQRPWVRDCLNKEAQDKLKATEERLHTEKQTGWWEKVKITLNRKWMRFKYYFNIGKEKELHAALAKRTTVSEAAATKDRTTFSRLERDLRDRGDLPEHQKTVVLMARYIEALKVYRRQIFTMSKVPEKTLKKLHELLIAIELTKPDCDTAGHKFYTEQLIAAFEKLLKTRFDEITKILPDQKNADEKAGQLKKLRQRHATVLKNAYERLKKMDDTLRLIAQEKLLKPLHKPLWDAAKTADETVQGVRNDKRPKSFLSSVFSRLRPRPS